MDKQSERIIKQLRDLAELLSLYDSEAVQIRIVEKILPFMLSPTGRSVTESTAISLDNVKEFEGADRSKGRKRSIKLSKLLTDLVNSGYFDTPKFLAEITEALSNLSGKSVQTTQMSGYLLSYVNTGRIRREKSTLTKRFVYLSSALQQQNS